MMGSDGRLPPTQFTKGLTRAELMLAQKLFRYDQATDMVRWKERTLDMFTQYKDPEYVMRGWTRGMVKQGWEVNVIRGVTPRYPDGVQGHPQWGRVDFTFRSVRYQWHMNDLFRLLAGRSMPEPMVLKRTRTSVRVDLVRDEGIIRAMIAVDKGGVLRWQPVTRGVWDRLLEIRARYGGSRSVVDPNLSHAAYTKTVGQPVTAGVDGLVRFGGQITVAWERVCEVVGVRSAPTRHERKAPAAPITDGMIRMLVFARYYPDVGEVRYGWKARTEDVWRMMVMCGVIDKMPSVRFRESWSRRFAGRRFGEGLGRGEPESWGDIAPFPAKTGNQLHDATIRVGKCLVKGRRLESVLMEHHEGVPDGYTHYCHYPANRGGF